MYSVTFRPLKIGVLCLLLPSASLAQDQTEVALVKQLFGEIQPLSIQKNREYCGYIGFDFEGDLIASKPKKGRAGSCRAREPRTIETIIASYHTHGAYSPDYYNEVPSGDDMEADEYEGIDGWVATPGGRLWYIDTDAMIAHQICGIACLSHDANFVKGDMGPVARSYHYAELVQSLEQLDAQ